MTSNDLVVAQFCIQFVPAWGDDGDVTDAWAERLTQGVPRKPLSGAVPVMMAVQLPKAAFAPLVSQLVTIELPGRDLVQLPAAGQVL